MYRRIQHQRQIYVPRPPSSKLNNYGGEEQAHFADGIHIDVPHGAKPTSEKWMPPWHTLKSLERGNIPPLMAQEFGVAVEELSQAQSV